MRSSTRRSFLAASLAAGTLLTGACGGTNGGGTTTPTTSPTPALLPSFVLIVGNDLDTTAMDIAMTRTQSLVANQGLRFSHFFSTRTLASSARATMLRGQYSHNHGVRTNTAPDGGFGAALTLGLESSTIATWLQTAGYRTAMMGRYFTGYPSGAAQTYIAAGWHEWVALQNPSEHDANRYFNYTLNDNGQLIPKGNTAEDYSTDVIARKAVDFLGRQTNPAQPFFVMIAPFACRNPATAAPRHEGYFADRTGPRVPSSNEVDVGDKPSWIRDQAQRDAEELAAYDEIARGRLRTLLAMDELVESVVNSLTSTGRIGNTYVIVTSDHGYRIGAEHRQRHGKQTAYEEDLRVPFFVRGPGIPAGQTRDQLCVTNDIAPTLAELAGVAAPGFVDGRSLRAVFGSTPPASTEWRRCFLVQHWRSSQDQGIPEYSGVRTRDRLYVEWPASSYSSVLEREVYELASDPYQLQSRHASVSAALLSAMAARLNTLKACQGASCRTAEDGDPGF